MRESSNYPPPPAWRPPPKTTPVWVWVLAGCGGLTLVVGVAIVMLVVKVGKTVGNVVGQIQVESEYANRDLKVVDQKLTVYQGKRYVVGTVKNVSTTDTYENVELTFMLLDKHGTELEEPVTAESKSPLKPGATWRFKAEVEDLQATSCKLTDVSGMREGATERVFGVKATSGSGK